MKPGSVHHEDTELPFGARLTTLAMHRDGRGSFTEIFRAEWEIQRVCQWSMSSSRANVLRGMHVHHRHQDYVVVIGGRMHVALFDLRPEAPTYRKSYLLEMNAERMSALMIPPGVVHGFYSPEPSHYVLGTDYSYDPDDELACHWADPELRIAWPCERPEISARDQGAGTLLDLEQQLRIRSRPFQIQPEA
jgi:dTDP-4-dehydrorhamnose 3,5-epimerase